MYSLRDSSGSEYAIKKFEYDYLIDKYGALCPLTKSA